MAEIVNLNRARKARERADAKARAAANRVAHGRSKADRELANADRLKRDQALDGARIERPDDEPA